MFDEIRKLYATESGRLSQGHTMGPLDELIAATFLKRVNSELVQRIAGSKDGDEVSAGFVVNYFLGKITDPAKQAKVRKMLAENKPIAEIAEACKDYRSEAQIKAEKQGRISRAVFGGLAALAAFFLVVNYWQPITQNMPKAKAMREEISKLEKKVDEENKLLSSSEEKTKKLEEQYAAYSKNITEAENRLDYTLKRDAEIKQEDIAAAGRILEKRKEAASLEKEHLQLKRSLGNIQKEIQTFSEQYRKIGCEYYSLGKTNKAIENLEHAVRLDSSNAKAFNALGSIYMADKQYTLARSYIEKAQAIEPYEDDFKLNRAACEAMMGNKQEAITIYDEMLRKNPRNRAAARNLGNLYYAYDENEKALGVYKKIVANSTLYCDPSLNDVREKIKILEAKTTE